MTAAVVKGLQINRRYLPNLIGNFVGVTLRLVFLWLVVNSVDPRSGSLFGQEISAPVFYLGAFVLVVFNWPILAGPTATVTQDLYNGTLEYLYSNPGSRYAYYVGAALTEILINAVIFVPFYLLLVYYANTSLLNMLMILLVCVAACFTLTALGVMFGLLALLWRRVRSLTDTLGLLFEILAGAYFPVSLYPKSLQYLVYLLPYTWGYDLIRYYSSDGTWSTLRPVWQEWLILLGFAVVYTLISRDLLKRAEIQAKRQGLHII